MKKVLSIIILSLLMLPMSGFEQTNKQRKVFVCTGKSATRYHYKETCHGLNRCASSIITITIEEAMKQGKTPCQICVTE